MFASKHSAVGALLLVILCAHPGCGQSTIAPEGVGRTREAVAGTDPIACNAWGYAAAANSAGLMLNASTLVDSYRSSVGAYGAPNLGNGALVQAAGDVTSNGGVVHGTIRQHSAPGFALISVPSGATNLPLGSSSPGSLNINTAADSITLAPGNYVAANINVSSPGAINVAPGGPVRIWVTGNLNLGGNENLNGAPLNLAFLVNSSGWVNVNSNGSLYGMIYAPTSGVNLSSSVFGSVIGSTVTLNSGAAVHADQSASCAQVTTANTPSGPTPLPAPPTQVGCYIGSRHGWLAVPCTNPAQFFPGFTGFNTNSNALLAVPSGSTSAPTLTFAQVEATVQSVDCETDQARGDMTACTSSSSVTPGSPGRNWGWGLQANSQRFACNGSTDLGCVDQFVVGTDAVSGGTAVCIEQIGGSRGPNDLFCVTANGTTTSSFDSSTSTRKGPLKAGDFANVAGFAFSDNGNPKIAVVAQLSWVSDQDVLPATETDVVNRIPGLYAVVEPDEWGLAQNWHSVSGGLVGNWSSTTALFTNGQVLTRFAASNCQGDVSAAGPTCSKPALSSVNMQFGSDMLTAEGNNLTVVGVPSVSFPNQNLAVTDVLSSTSGACLPGQGTHLFVRDTEGDIGGVPSNVGGVPFWESPDIFVVPADAPAPALSDFPADLQLTAGAQYKVYLRVHNELGCNDVTGPVSVFIDGADPSLGFANWQGVTPGADQGQYTTVGAATDIVVPKGGAAFLGPFAWTPTGTGHKCLLAAVAADTEMRPPASATAPVLPPAYNSNQIAQRNVQIGSDCTYSITNTTSSSTNLSLGITVTPASPAPSATGALQITLLFGDVGGTWKALWSNVPGVSASNDGTTTKLMLSSSYVALPTVPLPAGQSPKVSIQITPVDNPPTVNVSAFLVDPLHGNILQQNGGSCTGPQQDVIR